jgi:hypothetical protein
VNLRFPTNFVVEVEFISIESTQTTNGDGYYFDGYERKPTTHLRELRLTGSLADSRLTLSGKILNVH